MTSLILFFYCYCLSFKRFSSLLPAPFFFISLYSVLNTHFVTHLFQSDTKISTLFKHVVLFFPSAAALINDVRRGLWFAALRLPLETTILNMILSGRLASLFLTDTMLSLWRITLFRVVFRYIKGGNQCKNKIKIFNFSLLFQNYIFKFKKSN